MRTKEWLLAELQSLKAMAGKQGNFCEPWLLKCVYKVREQFQAALRHEAKKKDGGEVTLKLISAADDRKRS